MITAILFAICWIICGVIYYGLTVAYYQRSWPELAHEDRCKDRTAAAFYALFGPIALLAILSTGQYGKGWML